MRIGNLNLSLRKIWGCLTKSKKQSGSNDSNVFLAYHEFETTRTIINNLVHRYKELNPTVVCEYSTMFHFLRMLCPAIGIDAVESKHNELLALLNNSCYETHVKLASFDQDVIKKLGDKVNDLQQDIDLLTLENEELEEFKHSIKNMDEYEYVVPRRIGGGR